MEPANEPARARYFTIAEKAGATGLLTERQHRRERKMSLIRRRLKAADASNRPEIVWNAFVDILSVEDYDDLSPTQRVPHLVLTYDSEVQNGGHAQYFDNQGHSTAAETITALRTMGLECLAAVLTAALDRSLASMRHQDVPAARGLLARIAKWVLAPKRNAFQITDPDDAGVSSLQANRRRRS